MRIHKIFRNLVLAVSLIIAFPQGMKAMEDEKGENFPNGFPQKARLLGGEGTVEDDSSGKNLKGSNVGSVCKKVALVVGGAALVGGVGICALYAMQQPEDPANCPPNLSGSFLQVMADISRLMPYDICHSIPRNIIGLNIPPEFADASTCINAICRSGVNFLNNFTLSGEPGRLGECGSYYTTAYYSEASGGPGCQLNIF